MGYYLLDADNNPVLWPDQKMIPWARAFEQMVAEGRTIVKQEYVGDYWVSTVFLGLDHHVPRPNDNPHIFETMTFWRQKGDERLGEAVDMYRYSTWASALLGHNAIVATLSREHSEKEKHEH